MEIRNLQPATSNEDIIQRFNELIEFINVFTKDITLLDNLAGTIKSDILIPAGATVEISHGLKVVPKYRVILRQFGNGLITDSSTPWTDKVIYLNNNGASDVTLTILIMRG
jgi:hypothetical protein